ncbi:hypothetical protein ACIBH1_32835 [Nonomuraea sp. NPDC050663]|uniref:hypothetical protein n=1 Tax=Nonomuraea sp. NPDC050663 TaxID=3364370 RepID=UPI00379E9D35
MEVTPFKGADGAAAPPSPVMSWDDGSFVINVPGEDLRLRPDTLAYYHYEHADGDLYGLALLDRDGLILLDLPGEWLHGELRDFAAEAGLWFTVMREADVPVRLARRAPGWKRLPGVVPSPPSRWRKRLVMAASAAMTGAMSYAISAGAWETWRAVQWIGRMALELLDAKWAALIFSPLLFVLGPLKPLLVRLHRRRVASGKVFGLPYGINIVARVGSVQVKRGTHTLPAVHDQGLRLVRYTFADLTGLFIVDDHEGVRQHLPGNWPVAALDHFATMNGFTLETTQLTREEYIELVRSATDATF